MKEKSLNGSRFRYEAVYFWQSAKAGIGIFAGALLAALLLWMFAANFPFHEVSRGRGLAAWGILVILGGGIMGAYLLSAWESFLNMRRHFGLCITFIFLTVLCLPLLLLLVAGDIDSLWMSDEMLFLYSPCLGLALALFGRDFPDIGPGRLKPAGKNKALAGCAGAWSEKHRVIAICERNIKVFHDQSLEKITEIKVKGRPSRLSFSQDQSLLFYIAGRNIGVIEAGTWEQTSWTRIAFPQEHSPFLVEALYGCWDMRHQVLLSLVCPGGKAFGICDSRTGNLEILTLEEIQRVMDIGLDYYPLEGELFLLTERMTAKEKGAEITRQELFSKLWGTRLEKTRVSLCSAEDRQGFTPVMVTARGHLAVYSFGKFIHQTKLYFIDLKTNQTVGQAAFWELGKLLMKKHVPEQGLLVLGFENVVLLMKIDRGQVTLERKIRMKSTVDCLVLDQGRRLLLVTGTGGVELPVTSSEGQRQTLESLSGTEGC